MKKLVQRIQRVAESILGNERLTADLDDDAAQVLLGWGIACAKAVARDTADLEDAQAEEVMYPRLRATRRLMRQVNRWVDDRHQMDAESSAAALDGIVEQAAIIYGDDFVPPDRAQRDAFVQRHAGFDGPPAQFIAQLRQLLEPSGDANLIQEGGDDGQEKID